MGHISIECSIHRCEAIRISQSGEIFCGLCCTKKNVPPTAVAVVSSAVCTACGGQMPNEYVVWSDGNLYHPACWPQHQPQEKPVTESDVLRLIKESLDQRGL